MFKKFWKPFIKYINAIFNGEQEKKFLCEDWIENPSLVITVCHHPTSLVMPNSDPRDGFLSHPPTYDRFFNTLYF